MRWTWAAALTAAAVVALAAPRAAHAQQDPPAPAGRAATAPADRDAARARTVGTEVPELLDTLLGADTPRETRDEAARRLVSRQSDEARAALRQVVTSAGVSQDSRVAALRALADDPNPSPRLLNDLLAMLNEGNDRIVAAAAEALAGYKRSPQVVEALSALVRDGKRARPQREAAARALGRLPEQPAAAALVAVVTNPEEIPELVAVAADALVEMTGLEANGRDPGRWGQWLKQNGNLPPGEWARALLPARAAREDRVRHQAEESIAAIDRLLRLQYDETPNENRPRMLLRYLNDPSPEVRRVGARKANEVSALPDAAEQITEPVELRLVELTGDADPGVRLDAVRALENTPVDQALLLAVLLPQLRVESDPNVRQAIVRKLSRARVDQPKELGQILDELARLLDDASPAVVREAAIAIYRIVTRAPAMLKQDPAVARRIADRLRATMLRLAGQGGFQDARVECGKALAAFKDPQSRAFARELLNPRREPPAIRSIALGILGELGPPTADITVAVDNDPDPVVKLDGIRALARTGSFESSGWLAPRLNDPDPKTREAAADTYRKLLPTATPETLAIEADRRKANPALRVDILKVLLAKLTAAGNTGADAAAVNQNIGSNYLRDLNRPDLAVPYLRDALEQYRGVGWTVGATETLRGNLISAMLQSRQYTQLASMGQQWISGASDEATAATYRREIGLGIRNEAELLLTAYKDQSGPKWQENLNHAAALVDAGLKMEPPLEDRIRQDLTKLEIQVRDRAARSPAAR